MASVTYGKSVYGNCNNGKCNYGKSIMANVTEPCWFVRHGFGLLSLQFFNRYGLNFNRTYHGYITYHWVGRGTPANLNLMAQQT